MLKIVFQHYEVSLMTWKLK